MSAVWDADESWQTAPAAITGMEKDILLKVDDVFYIIFLPLLL